ncbi:MAG TPA: hypothetical protein VNG13_05160 [Mycobacteriales bacterium]|nr:hypothetical protein [Mycobacteriales bacterium]
MVEPDDDLRRRLGPPVIPLAPGPARFERIRRQARHRRRWRAAMTTMSTAALVAAAVVVGVAIGGGLPRPQPAQRPIGEGTPGVPVTAPPSATQSPARPTPAGSFVPEHLGLVDLSWVSDLDGWGLGTTPGTCASGFCTSLVRTSDGGASWVGIPAPHADLAEFSCRPGRPCVGHLRFADHWNGYAYGPDLFITTDGGDTWQRQPIDGTVSALEVAGGTAVAIIGSAGSGSCDAGCAVEEAAVGTAAFRPTGLVVHGATTRVVRDGGDRVYVAGIGPVSELYRSDDGGMSDRWNRIVDPCVAFHRSVVDLTGAQGGYLAVLCSASSGSGTDAVVASTDAGDRFGPLRPLPAVLRPISLASPRAGVLVLDVPPSLYVSTDAGRTWSARLAAPAEGKLTGTEFAALGFEDPRYGRVIVARVTVETTRDGGLTWIGHTFS